MVKIKNVCIFTGARSEYGLLKLLIEKVKKDSDLQLQLVVSGSHLSPEFGMTVNDIKKDGFAINEKIEILLSSDSSVGISKSMGLAFISLAESYERLKPDLLIVLGDRYEAFVAISAAAIANIPVAHLSGGDITEGAYDDAFRHSMTKMSYLHFPGTEESRKRIIQLGENPERVFNVGELGVETISSMNFYTKKEIEDQLKINLKEKYIVVVYHPVTLETFNTEKNYQELLNSLSEYKGYKKIFIMGNADSDGRKINKLLNKYVLENSKDSYVFSSVSIKMYLSLVKNSNLLIGNSSSGIIEAPSLGIPSINIGDRQKGRSQAISTINCEPIKNKIMKALEKGLSVKFNERIIDLVNPYGNGDTSEKIIKIIKEFLFEKEIDLKKIFYDIKGEM